MASSVRPATRRAISRSSSWPGWRAGDGLPRAGGVDDQRGVGVGVTDAEGNAVEQTVSRAYG
ncbi:hypothetical protein, partial [Nonomuraea sp. NPDC050691]|uniref:hypothetical protein n=1 Tax=Nonomuraea sp. NPDC050691 TaxID=3155661 RepID=UPI00340FC347